jgi:hypothetical protein
MIENPGFSYTTVEGVVEKRSLSSIKTTMGLRLMPNKARVNWNDVI